MFVPDSLRFVSLHSSSLSGSLPASSLLRRLRYLDAASNLLSGHVPAFEELTGLQYISLHTNQLSGTLSPGVGQLRALADRLYGHANSISGTLPSEIGLLTNIGAGAALDPDEWMDGMFSMETVGPVASRLVASLPTPPAAQRNADALRQRDTKRVQIPDRSYFHVWSLVALTVEPDSDTLSPHAS